MNLAYAVERLYDVGWDIADGIDIETLPDGRKFPSVEAVKREFAAAGLELSIKQNLMYKCFRATWAPAGETPDENRVADELHGTVIGACDREAAVYALSQLHAAQAQRQMTPA